MITSSYTTRVLTAEAGHRLTQSNPDIAAGERIITDRVFLAAAASEADWREITEAEAAALEAARAAAISTELNDAAPDETAD